jgi:hydrogenase maturation protease
MNARILVAGIGNIFKGDDAFGVEVIARLRERVLPEWVCVQDFGIRGFDLAYALMEPWEVAILVDATARGCEPGTIYVIEHLGDGGTSASVEPHAMDPVQAIALVKALGGTPPPTIVVGCEPQEFGGEDGAMGLTPAVGSALDAAVEKILQLIERFGAAGLATQVKVLQQQEHRS